MSKVLLFVAALTFTSVPAFSDVIAVDGSYHEFGFSLATSAVVSCGGGCVSTVNPVAENVSSPPWTFAGAATLIVLDLFQHGDRFEAFDFGASLGTTSVVVNDGLSTCDNDIACALGDAAYSIGIFNLGPGAHSLTLNIIQNASGTEGGAAVFSVAAAQVPEPGTYALFGLGLAGLAVARRRWARS